MSNEASKTELAAMMAMLPNGGVLHNLKHAKQARATDPAYEDVYKAARDEAVKRGLKS